MACRTFGRRHVLHEPVAIGFGRGFIEGVLQIAEDSKKPCLAPPIRFPVKEQVLDFLRQLLDRRAEVDSVRGSHELDLMKKILTLIPGRERLRAAALTSR